LSAAQQARRPIKPTPARLERAASLSDCGRAVGVHRPD